jgi:hypothetical protein
VSSCSRSIRTLFLPLLIAILFGARTSQAQVGAPTIAITPANGEYPPGTQLTVTVEFCDNNGLNSASAVTTFNGVNVNWPLVVTVGNPGPCAAKITRTGTVTLVAGTNTLQASIEDTSPAPLWSGWRYGIWTTPVPWAGVTIAPENQFIESVPSTTSTLGFLVTNVGAATQAFTVTPASSGLQSVGAPVLPGPRGTLSLAPGASGIVTISATTVATNNSVGRVTLTVSGGGQTANAFTEISSRTPSPLTNGLVLLNPTGITEKSLCLTIAAGPSAAAECGDLRIAHALPGVTTKNKRRRRIRRC